MANLNKMYLLGAGISHSKSPAHWRATFLERGLDWTYELMDLPSEPAAREFILSKDYVAINITTPWKSLALECADEVDYPSDFSRGCNFIVNKGGRLLGHNVDGGGCLIELQSRGYDMRGANVVVCGTGPTAKSVSCALAFVGSKVTLLTRSQKKTGELRVNGHTVLVETYDCSVDRIVHADFIINATTLGMMLSDPSPIDSDLLNKNQIVLDCIYGHGDTQIIKDARAAGATCFDGSGMLEAQAVCCEKILFEG